ncbi:DUF4222 domain-containing protein [Erwinia typographi]|uniref:DUF4222 domain-containing protein n=1 Tax=Erwinia typographi TaxID=371042 RepID=UPI000907B712|nr:DUF4222 domain-containing protein [Erwinia typographi]
MREPQVNSRWKDGRGELVTVTDVAFNFVRFIRDGYKFPVTYSPERFVKEFSPVTEAGK